MDLFEYRHNESQGQDKSQLPLPERLRPETLECFVGLDDILKTNSFLRKLVHGETGVCPNLILWGPPGSGKTTFARALVKKLDAVLISANAIDTGARALKDIGQAARDRKLQLGESTVLFIDEIHRLNKAQQDVLLPYTERGDLTLIGATTENPSYEINSALLSRSRVLVLPGHQDQSLQEILKRAETELKFNLDEQLSSEAQAQLIDLSNKDARQLLNLLDQILQLDPAEKPLQNLDALKDSVTQFYSKKGDEHYDTISAFIKSIRGSDPDAGLYYLARMLEGGEDPKFIARRLVILASEDVGNANPQALPIAIAGMQAVEMVGLPEAAINLAQVVTYIACSPKSNRSYEGLNKARAEVKQSGNLGVPKSLRSAQTKLSKQLGHGQDYKYSHSGDKGYIAQDFLPQELIGAKFYEPKELGFEKQIIEYLNWLKS
jgi:putative ATPase